MDKQPTIYIIGAGAIGKALAVFLQNAGRRVMLLRGTVDDGSIQAQHIHVETADGTVQEAAIKTATLSAVDTLTGIIVLANKSYGNENLARLIRAKAGTSPIVLLQNGLGVEKPFIEKDFSGVYRCVLFVTSQSINEKLIRFKPVAVCPVGIEKGDVATLDWIVQQLHTISFGFRIEPEIQNIIWKKAIVNSVFNSICPLLQTDNGIFYRNADVLKIGRRVIAECVAVANLKGILLSAVEVEESLLQISRLSDGQLISTLQDIQNNRRTEIDTLNVEIVRIAESVGLGDRVNDTRLLGELIKNFPTASISTP
ncbi:MAG: ketopantoate reductase family protein [Chitinophagaceae bacterium]|nr:MAG: ketopantoate reductase family protein [Chitinophagaceae bacterium]